ncbi:MAG: ATP-binding cassette domain-containing protein [Bacteroidia bacterium]|nr:ATP-binding cassette domain-containing protein [Bacteroidia bacterium]
MIVLENVSKSFADLEVLQEIGFSIAKGEKLCIIGKSGSGKSVLMKLITGLLQPETGKIYVDEVEISRLRESQLSPVLTKFGVVFQGAALFDSLNVLQNVGIKLFEERKLPRELIREKVIESLEQVGLNESILHKFPAELSGGMRKRVGIARAVILKPPYIFYDEPTTGLDPVNSEVIDNLIQQLSLEKDRTSVVITHDLATVRKIATKVALIHEKKLHFWGTAEELFSANEPVIQEFLSRSRSFGI